MKKKAIKKLIIPAIVVIIVIIIIIAILLKKNLKNENSDDIEINDGQEELDEEEYETIYEEDGDYSVLRDDNAQIKNQDYLAIQECTKKYLKDLNNEYIYTIVNAERLYNENIGCFIVTVYIQSKQDYSLIQDLYFILSVDDENLTFSIERVKDADSYDLEKIEKIESIEKNENNTFEYPILTEEEKIENYINIIKRISKVNVEFIYNKLEGGYRERNFDTIEKFQEYLEKNQEYINNLRIDEYETSDEESYLKYECLSQNGKYIYIYEKAPFDYELILN